MSRLSLRALSILIADMRCPNSTVPTEDQILVPETLLKKRKSQEKAREERSAELQKKKAVGVPLFLALIKRMDISCVNDGDDAYLYS